MTFEYPMNHEIPVSLFRRLQSAIEISSNLLLKFPGPKRNLREVR